MSSFGLSAFIWFWQHCHFHGNVVQIQFFERCLLLFGLRCDLKLGIFGNFRWFRGLFFNCLLGWCKLIRYSGALDNFTISMIIVVQIQFLKPCQLLGCLCFIAVFRMLIGGVSTFGLYLVQWWSRCFWVSFFVSSLAWSFDYQFSWVKWSSYLLCEELSPFLRIFWLQKWFR